MQFVDYAEVEHVEHMSSPDDLEWSENRKLLSELDRGSLYVTVGDDMPWLQINIVPGYSLALKPVLALYWLDEIQKFYEKKHNSLSETVKGGEE